MQDIKYKKKGYNCQIKSKDKIIYFMDCECWNFQNRQLFKIGKGYNTKIKSMPCKHLKIATDALLKQGYKLKEYNNQEGENICSTKLRKQLLELYKNECLDCQSKEDLRIHRLNPGYLDGKYSLMNCVVLCLSCHKRRHENEF